MSAVLLGQNTTEQQENQATYESRTEPVTGEYTHIAAFMILIDKDGNYVLEPDINKPVVPKRSPTASELKGALATVLGDIRTQETAILGANATIQGQMQMARQMQEQAQNQQILQQMKQPGR